MRVRILDHPDVIDRLNAETHAVKVVYNDTGWPDLPAMHDIRNERDEPWMRINNAFWLLVDASGEVIYGSSLEHTHRHLLDKTHPIFARENLVEALDRAQRDRADTDPAARALLDKELAETLDWCRLVRHGARMNLVRVITIDIAAGRWDDFLDLIRPVAPGEDDRIVPGVRNAVLHELGDFLVDHTPPPPRIAKVIRLSYEPWRESRPADYPVPLAADLDDGHPMPAALRYEAVRGIETITGESFPTEYGARIAAATAWWREHADDPRYRIEEPEEPHLRRAILRPLDESAARK